MIRSAAWLLDWWLSPHLSKTSKEDDLQSESLIIVSENAQLWKPFSHSWLVLQVKYNSFKNRIYFSAVPLEHFFVQKYAHFPWINMKDTHKLM